MICRIQTRTEIENKNRNKFRVNQQNLQFDTNSNMKKIAVPYFTNWNKKNLVAFVHKYFNHEDHI